MAECKDTAVHRRLRRMFRTPRGLAGPARNANDNGDAVVEAVPAIERKAVLRLVSDSGRPG
jgi:hypothetical protein